MGRMHPASGMEQARLAAGLSREAVAARLARSARTVERWEHGHTMPSRSSLLTLASLYGVAPAELVA